MWIFQLASGAFADSLPQPIRQIAQIIGGILAVLWGLELLDSILLGGALNRFGIRPRRPTGLVGILLAPLLHGNLAHLAANTGPLVILSGLILLGGVTNFVIVTAVAWLVSGAGVWLTGGSRTNHLGASGVVFGYFGFLLLRGYFEQSPAAIALAVLTVVLYGGLIWGILPIQRGKSWQSHLYGLAAGGLAARYLPLLQQQFSQWLSQS
ncbi:MAG: rhomboid family intramembrane serine protease [Leptolyngbya sp. SIO4C1]|nr:rhomboid family intramembrane serine protease [Leptolyngbya sp. SIO4C1]